jgi:hypothetical protein
MYLALASADAGKDFLAANSGKEGVVMTASGLQYKVVREGDGISPRETDLVNVHYHGTLIDGTVFDSSVDRGTPSSFALNQVIKGWTEGLQTMKQGGKTVFYIPPDIAYGDRSVGPIPANSTLVFEVELLKVYALNTPTSLAEVRAFNVSAMDCGNPPNLPGDKGQLAGIRASAESYTACARDYYKLVSMQLEGLMKLIEGADVEMRDAVLDKLRDSKQAMAVQLDPAVAFVRDYEALKAM